MNTIPTWEYLRVAYVWTAAAVCFIFRRTPRRRNGVSSWWCMSFLADKWVIDCDQVDEMEARKFM